MRPRGILVRALDPVACAPQAAKITVWHNYGVAMFSITRATAIVVAAAALSAPVAAQAESFKVTHLSGTFTMDNCIQNAQRVAQAYRDRYGDGFYSEGSWSVAVFDFARNGSDMTIACPTTDGIATPILVTHGESDAILEQAIDRVQAMW